MLYPCTKLGLNIKSVNDDFRVAKLSTEYFFNI
jgi:hypothetical protein